MFCGPDVRNPLKFAGIFALIVLGACSDVRTSVSFDQQADVRAAPARAGSAGQMWAPAGSVAGSGSALSRNCGQNDDASGSWDVVRGCASSDGADAALVMSVGNARAVASLGLEFPDHALRIARAGLDAIIRLTTTGATRLDADCATGQGAVALEDNDQSRKVSAGDVVVVRYGSCASGDSGALRISVDSALFLQTGGAGLRGTIIIDDMDFGAAPQTVFAGAMLFSYASSRTMETLVLEPTSTDTLSFQQAGRQDTLQRFRLLRRTDRQASTYAVEYLGTVRSESLGGSFHCHVSGFEGPGQAEPGDAEAECASARGAVRIANNDSNQVSVSLDARSRGDFSLLTDAEFWRSFTGDTLFDAQIAPLFNEQLAQTPELAVRSTVAMAVSDIAVSRSRNLIYVANGAGLQIVSAGSAEVVETVALPANPAVIALSDDEATLYIGYDTVGEVQPLDAETRVLGSAFELGTDPNFGTLYAEDIQPLAGQPGVVLVSLRRAGVSPRHGGTAVYDNGVARSDRTQDHTGSNRITQTTDGRLYGYNNESTEFGVRELVVSASGVAEAEVKRGLTSGFGSGLEAVGDFLIVGDGSVIDFRSSMKRTELRTDAFRQITTNAVDADGLRVYTVSRDNTITVWETRNFTPVARYQLPNAAPFPGSAPAIQHIVTTNDQIVLANDAELIFVAKSDLPAFPLRPCQRVDLSVVSEGSTAVMLNCDFTSAIYDAARGRVYAGISTSTGADGNAIAVINPESAMIEASFPIGGDPGHLELSDDGSRLLVSLNRSNAVALVDLTTGTVERSPALIDRNGRAGFASNAASTPNDPTAYLISMANGGGLKLFVAGIETQTYRTFWNPFVRYAPGNANIAYGLDGSRFFIYDVSPDNLSLRSEIASLVFGDSFQLADGRLYTSGGHRLNLQTLAVEWQAETEGRFVSVDVDAQRAYYYPLPSVQGTSVGIHALDTGALIGTVPLPGNQTLFDAKGVLAELPRFVVFVEGDRLLFVPKNELIP